MNYTDSEYQELEKTLDNSNFICNRRPDQFQYYQNELTKEIAKFLLKPYWRAKLSKIEKEEIRE